MAFLLCGQRLHYRRLNYGNKRHVRIRCNGNGAKQLRCKPERYVYCCRAVRTADYTYGGRFPYAEVKCIGEQGGKADGTHEGNEYAQLSSSAHEQGLGVGYEGTEVRARAHAHEYKAGVNAQFYAKVQIVYKTSLIAKRGPVNMAAGKKLAVIHFSAGQIGKQHTEGYRQQQQRLEFLHDGQIHQHQ